MRHILRFLLGLATLSLLTTSCYGAGRLVLWAGLTKSSFEAFFAIPFVFVAGGGILLLVSTAVGTVVEEEATKVLASKRPSTKGELPGAVSVVDAETSTKKT